MTTEQMYAAICELDHGLSPWELDFIDDVGWRVDTSTLTPAQEEKIKEIYERRCG